MKKIFIIANWKSNKTLSQAKEWLDKFSIFDFQFSNNKEIIICPAFTLLSALNSQLSTLNSSMKLGAQDISPFTKGSYTGEVNGKQIKESSDYVIIGHSERRKYFGETEEMVQKKLEMTISFGLTPIICISEKSQIQDSRFKIQDKKIIIAYEPLGAIGSGNPDNPESANKMALEIKKILGEVPVLYGGSVTSENVNSFTQMEHIDGVLVGKASLDSSEFLKLIQNA